MTDTILGATQPSDVRPIRADYHGVTGGDGKAILTFLLSPILVPFAICGESRARRTKARQSERVRFVCSRASLRGRDGIALVQGCELLRFDVERALELPNWCVKHADRVTFLLLGEVSLGKRSRESFV